MRTARLAAGILWALAALAQDTATQDEDFRVYTDPPRLFLTPQRLRLLRRERDRQSIRWQQLKSLVEGGADLPEKGFAYALYYQVTTDRAWADKAIQSAVAPNADPHQVALVFDWCRPVLNEAQSRMLAARLQKIANEPAVKAPAVRNRVLAAIAIADLYPEESEKALRSVTAQWWRGDRAAAWKQGSDPFSRDDTYAVYEILHSIRDNLKIDLRESLRGYFKELPTYHLVSHYPSPLPTPENEFRVPTFDGNGEPDLRTAALSRVAELSMVAYDNNALESQFLQGWLIQDRFLLRGVFGAPYEFLWANPYQPGLSYDKVPLVYHDKHTGRLMARSNWEEDADWFGVVDGRLQLFRDGSVQTLALKAVNKPLRIGPATIVSGVSRFRVEQEEASSYFVLGLKAATAYDVEIDDEEMTEIQTDRGGTLEITFPGATKAAVRFQPSLTDGPARERR